MTTIRFHGTMLQKTENLTSRKNFHFSPIPTRDKVRIYKAFIQPYTEIFAQAEPIETLTESDKVYKQNLQQILQLYRETTMNELSLYTGILSPSQRWKDLKSRYWHKLIKTNKKRKDTKYRTMLHKWIETNILHKEMPLLRELTLNLNQLEPPRTI